MTRAADATQPPTSLSGHFADAAARETLALVALWSRDEPHRVGEALLVPDDAAANPWVFGRGAASASERRLVFLRQRPGTTEMIGPVECPRISRTQIHVRKQLDELVVERVGRCPMSAGGGDVERATLRPGDVLELQNELLLLCVKRPIILPALPPELVAGHPFGEADAHGFVGESPAAWRVRSAVAAAARCSGHALVQGPSGSGKEIVVRALHAHSERAGRPLIARSAATIPEGLVDAELFGNIRNYPNPGTPERPGLVGQADGSTLFLDEIGELPLASQTRLLRVLDDGDYQRLGEAVARRACFRLVGATNRPESALKHDVLARLVVRVTTPGLNDRREDIPLLVSHLLRRRAIADRGLVDRFFTGAWPRISPALVGALARHTYTTHVRELDGLLVRSALESPGRYLDLTEGVRERLALAPLTRIDQHAAPEVFSADDRKRLELLRVHGFRASECGADPAYPGNRQTADLHLRSLLCRALQGAAWDVDAAAALLAGEDGDLRRRARARIGTFLGNLKQRLAEAPTSEAGRRAVIEHWRGDPALIEAVVSALVAGAFGAAPSGDP